MRPRLRLIDRVTHGLLALALLGSFVIAANAQKRKPVYYSIAVNRTLRVRINDSIGSERSRVGDRFSSTVVDPVYSKNGVLLIPEGSTVVGQVTNVARAQKKGKPGTMDVQFVSALNRSVALPKYSPS